MLGSHLIKSWSSTQQAVALSSGEAEFYGVVKAAGMALGYKSLLEDLGVVLPVRVWTDSTATIGICGRQGLGRLRHVDTQCLWIQQRVRDATIELRKVRGDVNPADLFTKHIPGNQKIRDLLELFGCRYESGRAASAPLLRGGASTQAGELLAVQQGQVETTLHRGRLYPAAAYEGEVVPEAWEHDSRVLPHFHADVDAFFPEAVAAGERGDEDWPEDTGLEHRGEALGRSGGCVARGGQ